MKSLFSPKPYESIITIPNIITSAGLALIGIYVYGFLVSSRWILMTSVFLSGCSDLLDGETARRLQQKTRLGEFLDRFGTGSCFWRFWRTYFILPISDFLFYGAGS